MEAKLKAFADMARSLNERLGIVPCLYGSFGLEQRTGENFNSDDIDILVAETFITERWNELKRLAEGMNYRLADLREHAFGNAKTKISFGKMDLREFAGIHPESIPAIETDGAKYMLPTLEQFLKIYEASSKDNYRIDKRDKKDFEKIKTIRRMLADGRHGIRTDDRGEI